MPVKFDLQEEYETMSIGIFERRLIQVQQKKNYG